MGKEAQPAGAGDGDAGDHAASGSPAWQTCGTHRFHVRGDVLFWETHGPLLVPDFIVLYDQRARLQRHYGYALVLFDARLQGGIAAEARRYLVTFKPDPPLRGSVAVFGAGLLVRTLVSLVQGAARKLGRSQNVPLAFGDDEASCWAVLARERALLLGAAPIG